MAEDDLVVCSRNLSAAIARDASALEDQVWAPFGFLSHTSAHQAYYSTILEEHADLQLCLVSAASGKPVALVNCVPFSFTGDLNNLPAEGWDWLVETGGNPAAKPANVLGALAVSVSTEHRGKGYARRMIQELKALAVRRRLDAVVVPVRPSAKSTHPFVPMDTYMHWRDDRGECFDPWLRSHLSQGARIIRSCERSMVVKEHVAFWETWAGRRFSVSDRYAFEGGLAPVSISLEHDTGRYEEPNVWVGYQL
ncbi:GNAT family N-acetyltransferase [Aureimonas psammosilenae]|uniref:GNAT family N-acetyltransferase n=1 Tax=Aureimonas psammosilenae TaxID=2495496 RepID=UPI0012605099|nr:GNAT family N-acetyltransferase [Aureimonas psammosilenae]